MIIKWVEKNDEKIERFKLKKLAKSIYFASLHTGEDNKALANQLAHKTVRYLGGKEVTNSVSIREAVLHVLHEDGYKDFASSYELASLHLPELNFAGVEKRSGKNEPFHPVKLFKSLRRACSDCGIVGGKISEELTKEITSKLEKEFNNKQVPTDEIRRITAQLLKEKGFKAIERAYIMHCYF